MKVGISSFKTRVANRIFIIFIISSIFPVSVFAIISFFHVRNQLIDQCNITLQRESKSLAVSLYERLDFLRSELRFIAAYYPTNTDDPDVIRTKLFADKIGEHFTALALLHDLKIKNIYGAIEQPFQLSSKEWDHLRSGKILLTRQTPFHNTSGLFMCIALNPESSAQNILIGKINQSYIIDVAERKPPLTELFVTDRFNSLLFSSMSDISSFPDRIVKKLTASPSGQFEWEFQGDNYMAGYSSIFLEPNFYYQEWIIVLYELKSDVLAPMDKFKDFFIFIIVCTFGFVFFLSINLIQKNTGPIEILKDATRKISGGSFGHRIIIESGDEFESLGRDFNEMSSKLKEGRELLISAAKMSTMGQMAAGIIHEIKQPLSAIYGNIELAMLDRLDADEKRDRLNKVLSAVDRLNSILEKFRSFSSPSKEIVEDVSINHTVSQIYDLMEHELHLKRVECIIEMEDNLPPVHGDDQELQQVVSNLIVNAIDALEDKDTDNRRIIIRTGSSEEKVFLSIDDNGCGIPKKLQERIFDPFFTTKTSDKGTGLGMAIIQSILHRHNATLELKSEEGKGAKFTITFLKSSIKQETL